jgi:chemotaxis response regulator CheB
MFIDNDPLNLAIFSGALNDVAPNTLCFNAPNGIEAFRMIARDKILPSYIIIESELPRMGARDFLKSKKKIQGLHDVPVIVHVDSPVSYLIKELREMGPLAFYCRPYDYYGVCTMLALCFNDSTVGLHQN